jgi:hypothetical protein
MKTFKSHARFGLVLALLALGVASLAPGSALAICNPQT